MVPKKNIQNFLFGLYKKKKSQYIFLPKLRMKKMLKIDDEKFYMTKSAGGK